MILFPRSAWTYHRTAWLEYRTKFLGQACGTAALLFFMLFQNIWTFTDPEMRDGDVLMSPIYLILNAIQLTAAFIFICFKAPLDIFAHFNVRPEI